MRTMGTAMINAMAGDQRLIWLAELGFDGGTTRLCTAAFDISYQGETFSGVGSFGAVEQVSETTDTIPTGLKLSLSGVDGAFVAAALAEDYQMRPVRVWLGALDDSNNLILNPIGPFAGRMDTMPVTRGAQSLTVSIVCTHELADGARPDNSTYSDADQRARYPDDGYCRHATTAASQEITF